MANSVDPDEMMPTAVSHLGLHRLLRPVCPNTYGKYGIQDADFSVSKHMVCILIRNALQSTLK